MREYLLQDSRKKKINGEKETKKIKGIGKGMVTRPGNFCSGHIFVDLSYLYYSIDFPKLSKLEGYRKHTRKEDGLRPSIWG